jgi:hypothetical protein
VLTKFRPSVLEHGRDTLLPVPPELLEIYLRRDDLLLAKGALHQNAVGRTHRRVGGRMNGAAALVVERPVAREGDVPEYLAVGDVALVLDRPGCGVGAHALHPPLVEHARRIEDDLCSPEHQYPGRLREGRIVADGDTDPPEIRLEDLELFTGRHHLTVVDELVGAMGLALLSHTAVRIEQEARIVVAAVFVVEIEEAPADDVDPLLPSQALEEVELGLLVLASHPIEDTLGLFVGCGSRLGEGRQELGGEILWEDQAVGALPECALHMPGDMPGEVVEALDVAHLELRHRDTYPFHPDSPTRFAMSAKLFLSLSLMPDSLPAPSLLVREWRREC